MTESDLQALLQSERMAALSGQNNTDLADQRSTAMEYYLGEVNDLTVEPDRSTAVSSDVADAVEGLMPSLMEIFASGDDAVLFEPVGQEDEEAAAQETDYVNYQFWQQNDGFLVTYSFIKDALLQKNAYVKVWWANEEEWERETYLNLGEDEFAVLSADPEVEIVEDEQVEEEPPPPPPLPPEVAAAIEAGMLPVPPAPEPVIRHNVTVDRKRQYGRLRIEPVPPEEIGVSARARSVSLTKVPYVYHDTRPTEASLIRDGYDADQIRDLPSAGEDDTEEDEARNTVEEDDGGAAVSNPETRQIRVTENYLRCDWEGNGRVRLYKIPTATGSGEILRRKGKPVVDVIPEVEIVSLTPVPMPHRHYGRSIADLVMDIQRIKTALVRELLNNAYLANNQKLEVAEELAHPKHTIDDLLSSAGGGIVRTRRVGGITPIPNQPLGQTIFPLLEYQDNVREWRSGVTKQGQGIDAEALANQSATSAKNLFTMAQAKVRLLARIMAETGFRDLFRLIRGTIRRNDRAENTVRLRGKWVTINPRDWRTHRDMTVNIGIAAGGRADQLQFLLALLGIQKEALQVGLATPEKIYNTLAKLTQLGDLKSPDAYFVDPKAKGPDGQPVFKPPPQQDPKMAEAAARLKLDEAKFQHDVQLSQAEMAMKAKQQEQELALKAREQDGNMAIKERQVEAEVTLKREQLIEELRLKRELAYLGVAQGTGGSTVELGGNPG